MTWACTEEATAGWDVSAGQLPPTYHPRSRAQPSMASSLQCLHLLECSLHDARALPAHSQS